MEPIDMHELRQRGPHNAIEELRIELYDKVNALGIGAQGLGGLSTVLDVKILDYPTHAASKPVAMIPNCAATRHAHFTLDGSGAAKLAAARSRALAGRAWTPSPDREARRSRHAHAGGGRDVEAGRNAAALRQDAHRPRRRAQAHRRPVREGRRRCRRASISPTASSTTSARSIRCATRSSARPGPTTATRMDKFTEMMLAKTGLDRDDRQGRARPRRRSRRSASTRPRT